MRLARHPLRRTRVALACAAAALAGGALAAPGADAPARRELVVCADPADLPFSNDRREGFENRIAEILADDLQADLRFVWQLQRRGFLRRTLQAGRCDVVIGVPAGLPGVATSRPLYRSGYAFVTRADGPAPQGFDDPLLRRWRIGLPALGAEGANPPPAMALAQRGLGTQVVGYPVWGTEDDDRPQGRPVEAVARGEVDTAIVWGPVAGWFAARQAVPLRVTLVGDDPASPQLPFAFDMALGVRRADTALLDDLQAALDRQRARIDQVLRDHAVPLVAPAPPAPGPLAQATPVNLPLTDTARNP